MQTQVTATACAGPAVAVSRAGCGVTLGWLSVPVTLMRYYSRVKAGRRRQATDDIAGLITPSLNVVAGVLNAA